MLSCETETSWELHENAPVLIVDAIITNENKAHAIRVYHSSTELNAAPQGISGVNIRITDGTNWALFTESESEKGLYISPAFAATGNRTYALLIEYNGFRDTAYAQMAAISPIRSPYYTYDNGLYTYNYTGSDLPAMTEVFYDWSHLPDFCEEYGSCQAAQSYYSLNNIDIVKEFAPEKQTIPFPAGTKVIQRKYSLSEAHQQFVRSLLIETQWRGGIFDIEHGNVPTNFNYGVRGWFATCMVLSDTTVVN